MTDERYQRLRDLLRGYGSCLVAYSGGVDSVFLAYVAHETLGSRALAVIADSPSLPRREMEEALDIGRKFGFVVRVIRTREFTNADFVANPSNRCYFCKQELFSMLTPIAREEGFDVIVYGENAGDTGDFRPGARAAEEFNVRTPLKEAGLTKQDIRDLSAHLGLPTADKPQMACLSSRVPYGESVTPAKLKMVEEAEMFLHDMGLREVRVRHHELRPTAKASSGAGICTPKEASGQGQHLARIETDAAGIQLLLEEAARLRVSDALKRIGYQHVTLDLLGYRRGSLNEMLGTLPPAPKSLHG